jgi:hypothetical protein
MSETLTQIATRLSTAKNRREAKEAHESDVRVQLIYAFNGIGKTRLWTSSLKWTV